MHAPFFAFRFVLSFASPFWPFAIREESEILFLKET